MGFLGALLGAYGNYGQAHNEAKNQAYARALDQQRLGQERDESTAQRSLEQQRIDAEKAYQTSEIDARKAQTVTDNRAQGIGPDGKPLPFTVPPALSQISPNNKGKGGQPDSAALAKHYRALQGEAIRQNNPYLAKQYGDLASGYELGAQREASAALSGVRGQEITQGKIPLEQAQAGWWKTRHQEVEDGYRAAYARADLSARARMNAAASSARSRLAGASFDERETIALQTAINAAQGKNADQAFTIADQQFKAAQAVWQKQHQQSQLGIGTDPGPPPNPSNYFNIAPPNVTVNTFTLPDGRTVNLPNVQRGQAPPPPGSVPAPQVTGRAPTAADFAPQGDRLAPLRAQIQRALKAGQSPQALLSLPPPPGYTTADVRAALSPPGPQPLPLKRPVLQGISPLLLGH